MYKRTKHCLSGRWPNSCYKMLTDSCLMYPVWEIWNGINQPVRTTPLGYSKWGYCLVYTRPDYTWKHIEFVKILVGFVIYAEQQDIITTLHIGPEVCRPLGNHMQKGDVCWLSYPHNNIYAYYNPNTNYCVVSRYWGLRHNKSRSTPAYIRYTLD